MARQSAQRAAFTLLEMVVAMALMTMLAGSLYASLYTAFRSREAALRAVEPARRAELAMELLRSDIASALPPVGILAGEFIGTDAVADTGQDADSLLLHLRASPGQSTVLASGVHRVELALNALTDGLGYVLVRRTTENLLAPETPEPREEVLCRSVSSFNLAYFDGTVWADSWDSGAMDNALPLAVEVVLELAPPAGAAGDAKSYSASRVVLIPCGGAPAGGQTQVTRQGSRR